MRYLFAIAVFAVSLCGVSSLRAQDSLFSEVAMESVFEKTDAETLERITSVFSLARALENAGFEAKVKDGKAMIELKQAYWKLPVSMEVLIQQDRIVCEMSLIEIDDQASIETGSLLKLLASGNADQGAFFAYDRANKLIQLRSSFRNRALTAKQLKDEVLRLGLLAEQHAEVWSKLKTAAKPEVAATTPQSTPKKLSVLGTWSASLSSSESFAIQFASDGKFKLVHLKSGKSAISKGKASRSGNRLTLVGDDKVTLNCQVTQSTEDKFQLAILNANGKAAVNLDFKKAK